MSTAKTQSPGLNTGSGHRTAEDQVPDLVCTKNIAPQLNGSLEQGLRQDNLSQKALV